MIQINGKLFFDGYRKELGNLTQEQVDGLNDMLGTIETSEELTDIRYAAYMLATAWRETAQTYKPITEYGGVSYFNKYDGRGGNDSPGDGFRYRGRGYVQLTFKNNYKRAGDALTALKDRYPDGVDLVANPEYALDPKIAGDIMLLGMTQGWFTGKKLSDYITAVHTDYVQARKIINGLDHALEIADTAEKYEAMLKGALVPASTATPVAGTQGGQTAGAQSANT